MEKLWQARQPGECTENQPWIEAVQADTGRPLLLGTSPKITLVTGKDLALVPCTSRAGCSTVYPEPAPGCYQLISSALSHGCPWPLPRRMLSSTQATLVPRAFPEGGGTRWAAWEGGGMASVREVGRRGYQVWKGS